MALQRKCLEKQIDAENVNIHSNEVEDDRTRVKLRNVSCKIEYYLRNVRVIPLEEKKKPNVKKQKKIFMEETSTNLSIEIVEDFDNDRKRIENIFHFIWI